SAGDGLRKCGEESQRHTRRLWWVVTAPTFELSGGPSFRRALLQTNFYFSLLDPAESEPQFVADEIAPLAKPASFRSNRCVKWQTRKRWQRRQPAHSRPSIQRLARMVAPIKATASSRRRRSRPTSIKRRLPGGELPSAHV